MSETGPSRTGWWTWLALAAIVVGAAALYLVDLGVDGLLGDEFTAVLIGREPFSEILRLSFVEIIDPAYGRNRPAFHLLVHASQSLFEDPELAARLPAALAGVLGVLAMFYLGLLVHGPREGLLGALFLATSHAWLWSSREALAFAPMVLCVILAMIAAVAAVRGSGLRWWAATGAAAAVGYYFHPIATLPACAILLLIVLAQIGLRRLWVGDSAPPVRERVRGLAACFGSGFVLMLPALWCLFWLFWWSYGPDAGVQRHDPHFLAGDRSRISVTAKNYEVARDCLAFVGPGTLWGFGIMSLLVLVGLVGTFRRARFAAWLTLFVVALPLALFLTMPFAHGFGSRYLIFFLPALSLLEAHGLVLLAEALARGKTGAATALVVSAGVGLALLDVPAWFGEVVLDRDWPSAVGHLESSTEGHTLLLVAITAKLPALDQLGRRQTTFYLQDPERFTYCTPGAGATSIWFDAVAELEPHQSVVAIILHGEQVRARRRLDGLAVERLDHSGLTTLIPTDRGASAHERLAHLLIALSQSGIHPLDATFAMSRGLDALVVAMSTGTDAPPGLPVRVAPLWDALDPRVDSDILVRIDERLLEVAQLLAEVSDGGRDELLLFLEQRAAGIALARLRACSRARADGQAATAARHLLRAVECGPVPPDRLRILALECRAAGLDDEATALESALSSQSRGERD